MVVSEGAINNIMGGMENTGGVRLHSHRHKLKQRFDIVRKLGQGTYGKVQLAINKETGQEVAIKTIKKAKIETEQDLVRIRREIQIMSSVQHPQIIHIYEVFENREKMVLVMEYAAGGELYDYLSERKVLAEMEARRIFRQVAASVYYCHKHKICHRDLKLENILLDLDGNAKIADFGLSNVFDEKRRLDTFCGSPLYASPEIVKGIPYVGPEVDCWSLGVLLYTLVYGAMPFDGSNFRRLVKQITQGDFYEPSSPSNASELIRHMLTVPSTERATIEDICSHWWVNDGYSESCLVEAETLASQTPVRLDLLLSLAPKHISSEHLLIQPEDEDLSQKSDSSQMATDVALTSSEIEPEAAISPAKSHSVGSLPLGSKMDIDLLLETNRREREVESENKRRRKEGTPQVDKKKKVDSKESITAKPPSGPSQEESMECKKTITKELKVDDNKNVLKKKEPSTDKELEKKPIKKKESSLTPKLSKKKEAATTHKESETKKEIIDSPSNDTKPLSSLRITGSPTKTIVSKDHTKECEQTSVQESIKRATAEEESLEPDTAKILQETAAKIKNVENLMKQSMKEEPPMSPPMTSPPITSPIVSSQNSSLETTPARSRTGSESSSETRPARGDSSRRHSKVFSKAALFDSMLAQGPKSPPSVDQRPKKINRPGALNMSDLTKRFEEKSSPDKKNNAVVPLFKVSDTRRAFEAKADQSWSESPRRKASLGGSSAGSQSASPRESLPTSPTRVDKPVPPFPPVLSSGKAPEATATKAETTKDVPLPEDNGKVGNDEVANEVSADGDKTAIVKAVSSIDDNLDMVSPAKDKVDVVSRLSPVKDKVDVANKLSPAKDKVDVVSRLSPVKDKVDVANKLSPVKDKVDLANRLSPVKDKVDVANRLSPVKDKVDVANKLSPVKDKVDMENRLSPVKDKVDVANRLSPVKDKVDVANRLSPVKDKANGVNRLSPVKDKVEVGSRLSPVKDKVDVVSIIPVKDKPASKDSPATEISVKKSSSHKKLITFSKREKSPKTEIKSPVKEISKVESASEDIKESKLKGKVEKIELREKPEKVSKKVTPLEPRPLEPEGAPRGDTSDSSDSESEAEKLLKLLSEKREKLEKARKEKMKVIESMDKDLLTIDTPSVGEEKQSKSSEKTVPPGFKSKSKPKLAENVVEAGIKPGPPSPKRVPIVKEVVAIPPEQVLSPTPRKAEDKAPLPSEASVQVNSLEQSKSADVGLRQKAQVEIVLSTHQPQGIPNTQLPHQKSLPNGKTSSFAEIRISPAAGAKETLRKPEYRTQVTRTVVAPQRESNSQFQRVEPQLQRAKRERIIPIMLEEDDGEIATEVKSTSSSSGRLGNFSATSVSTTGGTPDSEKKRTTAVPPSEPIRKSRRERIIPIAVEGEGIVTPPIPEGEGAEVGRGSFQHLAGGQASLNEREMRKRERTPMSPFGSTDSFHSFISLSRGDKRSSHNNSRGRGFLLERNESFSSAGEDEDDEDDGFQILTAESLFSTLLSRVRSLTRKMTDEGSRRRNLLQHPHVGMQGLDSSVPSGFWSTLYSSSRESPARRISESISRAQSREESVSGFPASAWGRTTGQDPLGTDSVFSDGGPPPPFSTLPRGWRNRSSAMDGNMESIRRPFYSRTLSRELPVTSSPDNSFTSRDSWTSSNGNASSQQQSKLNLEKPQILATVYGTLQSSSRNSNSRRPHSAIGSSGEAIGRVGRHYERGNGEPPIIAQLTSSTNPNIVPKNFSDAKESVQQLKDLVHELEIESSVPTNSSNRTDQPVVETLGKVGQVTQSTTGKCRPSQLLQNLSSFTMQAQGSSSPMISSTLKSTSKTNLSSPPMSLKPSSVRSTVRNFSFSDAPLTKSLLSGEAWNKTTNTGKSSQYNEADGTNNNALLQRENLVKSKENYEISALKMSMPDTLRENLLHSQAEKRVSNKIKSEITQNTPMHDAYVNNVNNKTWTSETPLNKIVQKPLQKKINKFVTLEPYRGGKSEDLRPAIDIANKEYSRTSKLYRKTKSRDIAPAIEAIGEKFSGMSTSKQMSPLEVYRRSKSRELLASIDRVNTPEAVDLQPKLPYTREPTSSITTARDELKSLRDKPKVSEEDSSTNAKAQCNANCKEQGLTDKHLLKDKCKEQEKPKSMYKMITSKFSRSLSNLGEDPKLCPATVDEEVNDKDKFTLKRPSRFLRNREKSASRQNVSETENEEIKKTSKKISGVLNKFLGRKLEENASKPAQLSNEAEIPKKMPIFKNVESSEDQACIKDQSTLVTTTSNGGYYDLPNSVSRDFCRVEFNKRYHDNTASSIYSSPNGKSGIRSNFGESTIRNTEVENQFQKQLNFSNSSIPNSSGALEDIKESEDESVMDRITRKSYYSRFNEIKRKPIRRIDSKEDIDQQLAVAKARLLKEEQTSTRDSLSPIRLLTASPPPSWEGVIRRTNRTLVPRTNSLPPEDGTVYYESQVNSPTYQPYYRHVGDIDPMKTNCRYSVDREQPFLYNRSQCTLYEEPLTSIVDYKRCNTVANDECIAFNRQSSITKEPYFYNNRSSISREHLIGSAVCEKEHQNNINVTNMNCEDTRIKPVSSVVCDNATNGASPSGSLTLQFHSNNEPNTNKCISQFACRSSNSKDSGEYLCRQNQIDNDLQTEVSREISSNLGEFPEVSRPTFHRELPDTASLISAREELTRRLTPLTKLSNSGINNQTFRPYRRTVTASIVNNSPQLNNRQNIIENPIYKRTYTMDLSSVEDRPSTYCGRTFHDPSRRFSGTRSQEATVDNRVGCTSSLPHEAICIPPIFNSWSSFSPSYQSLRIPSSFRRNRY